MSTPSGDSQAGRELLDVLAEEFAARARNGEQPSISEYALLYPQYAKRIKELFPLVEMMEQFRQTASNTITDDDVSGAPLDIGPETQPKQPTLGDYVLLSRIGGGGMGRVFKAKHRRMDRLVAKDDGVAAGPLGPGCTP